jgi:hypothetical protein
MLRRMKPQVFFWWLAYAALEPFGLPALAEERPEMPPALPPRRMTEEELETNLREWFEGSNQALREARTGGRRRRQ